MNRIWNSNYNDNFNIRRMPSKDNFKIGEMVYGRVVKSIDVNEAIIKLINGLELHAELEGLDGGVNEIDKGLVKFIVESFNDNKVQLKIFKSPEEKSKTINDELLKFISAEGLSEDDGKILESMLKFDMTLTKENIRDIKSLIQFKERISTDPEEINIFIDKYLGSKDIKTSSEQGQIIKEKLSEFFKAFNALDMEEVLLFLENDIEFSKESIDSYKNMFSGNDKIDNSLQSKIDKVNGDNNAQNKINIEEGNNTEPNIISKDIEEINPKVNRNIDDAINSIKNEVEKLSLNNKDVILSQKVVTGIIKEAIENLFMGKNIEISSSELDIINNIIKNDDNKSMDKSNFEKLVSNLVGKEVTLSEKEYKDIFSFVKMKDGKSQGSDIDLPKIPKEIIKEALSTRAEEGKEVIKNVLKLLNDGLDSPELLGIIKNNISDIKLFNKLSDQYYYVNVPLNFNEKEYPCKIIIKDKRKEGKSIDSKNVKLVLSLKTTNFGVVDSYVQVLNKSISIKLTCNEQYMKLFEISKSKLESTIEALGFSVKVAVEKKQEDVSLTTCREFFGDNNVAGIDIKV